MADWPWLLLLFGVTLGAASTVRCCGCWNSTEDGAELEIECHCTGLELHTIPVDLDRSVQRITVAGAGVSVLYSDAFRPYSSTLRDVVLVELASLRMIEPGTFMGLPLLRTIDISRAPALQVLPHGTFHGVSTSLNTLRIMHTGLLHVPDLASLGAIMNMVDLVGNNIRSIHTNALRVKADELLLDYNEIAFVEAWAFNGSEIAKLSFKGNKALSKLSLNAFLGLKSLRELDLSGTAITQLPTGGLEELEILRIEDTRTLKVIPSVYSFKHLHEAWLTYSFHCCAFKFPEHHDPERHTLHQAYLTKVHELCEANDVAAQTAASASHRLGRRRAVWDGGVWSVNEEDATVSPSEDQNGFWGPASTDEHGVWDAVETTGRDHQFDPYQHDNSRHFLGHIESGSGPVGRTKNATIQTSINAGFSGVEYDNKAVRVLKGYPTLSPDEEGGVFHQTTAAVPPQQLQAICGTLARNVHDIRCHPAPDAFNPCEDIMGTAWLRVAVWFVVVTAVVGNLAVVVVLASSRRSQMTVPKFLMCNLALADLCMGTYLLLIAGMDLHSIGVYFNYALDWQQGLGCKIAGFVTVFASQLSVFTLSVLTLERWLAITFAMHLNKRLGLRGACRTMIAGWTYALTMATLPLFGISGYSKTSICLPMETREVADKTYLVLLLLVNAVAFVLILACYVHIYFSLDHETRRGSSSVGGLARGEMNVAKKMALLVFTDLACWAPIAFFALTAVAGYPLIDVTRSKILLVFFYPLNSCANPFLYAILTSQYRKDLFLLLDRYGMCKSAARKYKRDIPISNNAPVRSLSSGPLNLAQQEIPANITINPSDTQSPTLIKQCIILHHGNKCTVCVIGNQQETFL